MMKNLGKLFHWSKDYSLDVYQLLVAVIGMTFLIILGVITGHTTYGVFASLSGLALSGSRTSGKFSTYFKDLLLNMIAGTLGFLMGNYISSHSLYSLFIFPSIFITISTIGGISKIFARTTTILLLFWIITTNLNSGNANILEKILLFFTGSIILSVFAAIFWPVRKLTFKNDRFNGVNKHTPYQLITHWRNTLMNFQGWQYGLRLATCSFFAILVIIIYPFQHSSWILLTIVIVIQRNIEKLPIRILQRSIGTLAGVAILGFLTSFYFELWLSVFLIAIFIGARILLKEGNYLFYSVVMTGLVIFLIDFGQPLFYQVILDRMIATLIGSTISFIFGYIIWLPVLRRTKT
jgi:hypothetical protein